MIDGNFVFYTIQHRRTHESPWLQPNGPLTLLKEREWSFSSWDHFGYVAEPWHGSGNNYKPKYKKSHDETHDVWSKTGYHGWWTVGYAIKAMSRLTNGSEQGKFNSKDGYGKVHQSLRYEFRIVRVEISRKVEELTVKHMIDELVSE